MIPRVKILLVTHLQSWGCRGHSWGLVGSQDGSRWKSYHYSWPHFWNHDDIFTLGWVIKFPKKGLGFGPKSAKKAHCESGKEPILWIFLGDSLSCSYMCSVYLSPFQTWRFSTLKFCSWINILCQLYLQLHCSHLHNCITVLTFAGPYHLLINNYY